MLVKLLVRDEAVAVAWKDGEECILVVGSVVIVSMCDILSA